jgi:hypothetical protein
VLGKSRAFVRITVVLLTVAVGLAITAVPALAAREEGIDPGKGIGLGVALVIFVGIPLGVFVVIALLVYGPTVLRRPRYRPGYQDWGYRSLWIGGPDDPDTALTRTAPEAVVDVRGGGAGAGW